MAGFAGANLFVVGVLCNASGIAGAGGCDSFDTLVDGFDAPETSAADNDTLNIIGHSELLKTLSLRHRGEAMQKRQ